MHGKTLFAVIAWMMAIVCGLQIQELGEKVFNRAIVIQLVISVCLMGLVLAWDEIF